MRLSQYLRESIRYGYRVVEYNHSNGYYDKTVEFKVPDKWNEFDTTNRRAGLHVSLSEFESNDEGRYWNFGYSLIASSLRYGGGNTTVSNGSDAKKYYPLQLEREYIKDVLYELVEEFVKVHKSQVPVIIRGPLNDFKVGLERYKHITDIIKSCGYGNIETININGSHFIIQSQYELDDISVLEPAIKKRWREAN